MGRDRRQSPRLESLEGRQLLSGVHFDHVMARPAAPLVLNGTLQGDLTTYASYAGPPRTMVEAFSGRARSMGRVKALVVDQLDASGSLIGGTITLANARGTVVLGFGPGDAISSQQAGSMSNQVVRYTVVAGTGAYAYSTGSGTFTALQDAGKSSALVFETITA